MQRLDTCFTPLVELLTTVARVTAPRRCAFTQSRIEKKQRLSKTCAATHFLRTARRCSCSRDPAQICTMPLRRANAVVRLYLLQACTSIVFRRKSGTRSLMKFGADIVTGSTCPTCTGLTGSPCASNTNHCSGTWLIVQI